MVSYFGVAVFFYDKAKNAGIAVAMMSIFNDVGGRKRPSKLKRYLVTIPKVVKTH